MPEARQTVTRELPVPEGGGRHRADRFVADATGLSRTYVQKLISAGHLVAAGQPLRANTLLEPGSAVTLTIPPAVKVEL
ncbi:MAG TPA: hypothetical protein VNF73_16495, partial [Candidatus Saccharimonadales bacterium]|nr:hypothetical protein [Candidatus Saccharimonadales bacterium]